MGKSNTTNEIKSILDEEVDRSCDRTSKGVKCKGVLHGNTTLLHIKALYGIILLLLTLIILVGWILNEQIRNMQNQQLLSLDDRQFVHRLATDYRKFINKSALWEYEDVLGGHGNKRNKRHTDILRDILSEDLLRNRQKRSGMESKLHDYCKTVYDICDVHRAPPGPPAMSMGRGPPGPPGPQGPKGNKGDEGPEGTPGSFGFDGIPGNPGNNGEPGRKGERGLVGFTGEKGEKGAPGHTGEKGARGPEGVTGPTGPPGPSGPRGPPGPMGLEGLRGQNGVDGKPGEKGDKGNDGSTGEKGLKGHKGEDGIRGPPGYGINCVCEKGSKGDRGQRGLVGFTGYKGDKGDKGVQGDRGFTGAGVPGPVGPPGRIGDKGQKGDCDEWKKNAQDWRAVTVEKGSNNQYKDIPQQDYQAHETRNKQGASGARVVGYSESNTNTPTKKKTKVY